MICRVDDTAKSDHDDATEVKGHEMRDKIIKYKIIK